MSDYSCTIDIGDGQGERDISAFLRTFSPTERLCSDSFGRAVSQCHFVFVGDPSLIALLAQATSYSVIRVSEDGEPLFTGRIPPAASFVSSGAAVSGQPDISDLELDATDLSNRLDRSITADDGIAWENHFVLDPDNPGLSIAHRLLDLCGISGAMLVVTEVERTVLRAFAVDSGTVGEALDQLLREYGLVLRQLPNGSFMIYRWLVEAPAPTITLDDATIMASLKAERVEREADAVELSWYALKDKADCLIFMADLPFGDDNRRSGYPIQAGLLWPEEANVDETWWDYQDTALSSMLSGSRVIKNTDFTQIVLTKNHSIDAQVDSGITVGLGPIFQNARARVAYLNSGAASANIYYCDIYADVVYRAAQNLVTKNTIAAPIKTATYEARYLHDAASATRFTCALADLVYSRASWRYTFPSEAKVELGTIAALHDPSSGLVTTIVIVERSFDPETQIYSYKALSVAPVVIDPTASYVAIPPAVPAGRNEDPSHRLDALPTYWDLQQGYSRGGGTTIPAVPALTAQSGFRAVTLVSDKQASLTNLAAYEWQVGPSAAGPWYSLRWDGYDYKGDEGSWTSSPGEVLVHPNIPLAGTAEAPLARILWYRARRLTKAAVRSVWSTPVQGVASQIQTGDIAANAVTANKLAAAVVEALSAVIQGDVVIDKDIGFLSGQTGEVDGNEQAYLNELELAFRRYWGGMWHTMASLSRRGLYAQQQYSDGPLVISNGTNATRRARGLDLGRAYPSAAARVYHFDGDVADQLGTAGWTITGSYGFDLEDVAILAMAPFTVDGASLLGDMRLTMSLGAELFGDWWTDLWFKIPASGDNFEILSIGNSVNCVKLRFQETSIAYIDPGASGELPYTDPGASGQRPYLTISADTNLSILAIINGTPTTVRRLIQRGEWVHVALGLVVGTNVLHVIIGTEDIQFSSFSVAGSDAMELTLNDDRMAGLKYDELLYDLTQPIVITTAIAETNEHIPWAANDYTQRTMVLEAYDPDAKLLQNLVRSGESADGYWVRLPDGTLLIDKVVSYTGAISTSAGVGYKTAAAAALGSWPAAAGLVSLKSCEISVYNATKPVAVESGAAVPAVVAPGSIYLWSPASQASDTYSIHIRATGRWRA
ncbi:MAG TPA: hypothetical protein PLB91_01245 [Spirochaetales bacterium]|nr:hypothetical protein [Spirochaetales bacterium]HRY54296.1 hypothetical protein [Spirochaetia bacterium]